MRSRPTIGAIDRIPNLLRVSEVERLTTLDVRTIDRLVEASLFPRPLLLTAARRAFVQSEVAAWLAERQRFRDDNRAGFDPVVIETRRGRHLDAEGAG